MSDRIKQNDTLTVQNRFLEYFLAKESAAYEDEAAVKQLIAEYISFKVDEAKKQGAREILTALESEVTKVIGDYISLVNKIADFVDEASEKEFQGKNFKSIQTRTKFDMFTQQIKILFIIDTDLDTELLFSDLLGKTEKWVFETERSLAQLSFVNQQNLTLNTTVIKQDYPSHRKDKNVI